LRGPRKHSEATKSIWYSTFSSRDIQKQRNIQNQENWYGTTVHSVARKFKKGNLTYRYRIFSSNEIFRSKKTDVILEYIS